MALPAKKILEDPGYRRVPVDSCLGYPRRWWQHPLCWLGLRRRRKPARMFELLPLRRMRP